MLTYWHIDAITRTDDGATTVTITGVAQGRQDDRRTFMVARADWATHNTDALNRLVAHHQAMTRLLDEPNLPIEPPASSTITPQALLTTMTALAHERPIIIPYPLRPSWQELTIVDTPIDGEVPPLWVYKPWASPFLEGAGMAYQSRWGRWATPTPTLSGEQIRLVPSWARIAVAATQAVIAWNHPAVPAPVFTGIPDGDMETLAAFLGHDAITRHPLTATSRFSHAYPITDLPSTPMDAIPAGATVILAGACHQGVDLIGWAGARNITFATFEDYQDQLYTALDAQAVYDRLVKKQRKAAKKTARDGKHRAILDETFTPPTYGIEDVWVLVGPPSDRDWRLPKALAPVWNARAHAAAYPPAPPLVLPSRPHDALPVPPEWVEPPTGSSTLSDALLTPTQTDLAYQEATVPGRYHQQREPDTPQPGTITDKAVWTRRLERLPGRRLPNPDPAINRVDPGQLWVRIKSLALDSFILSSVFSMLMVMVMIMCTPGLVIGGSWTDACSLFLFFIGLCWGVVQALLVAGVVLDVNYRPVPDLGKIRAVRCTQETVTAILEAHQSPVYPDGAGG